MPRYAFDCETDGLLDTLTTIHSLVLIDVDTGEMAVSAYQHLTITVGLTMLMEADEIIGHNVIGFDIPAIQKVYPWFQPKGTVSDTLVASRLIWSDLADEDFENNRKAEALRVDPLPNKMIGSHSLKAWGYRLGILKGDFGATADWSVWSPEMQLYCEQDVRVTVALYRHISAEEYSSKALDLEHEFATVIAMQERHGFAFNEAGAISLYQQLVKRRMELAEELKATFPPKEVQEVFIPKRNNKTLGYVKDFPFTKTRMVEFNPSSRQMIADRLMDMGWRPEELTPSGQAKIDETILSRLPYPEARLLAEHFLVEKRIGQISEGDQAWLKLVRAGRIHGRVNTNGAVTGRCTHSNPNVAQVPRVGSPYGAECRSLFTVRNGYSLVGADLSGLELRCLAHYMALYDGGAYATVLLEGDIHTVNQQAAGLPTRNDAKTFIYAFLYGAGPVKIGSIVEPTASEERQKLTGIRLQKAFLRKTPALARLRDTVRAKVSNTGRLIGLDGRILKIRSQHSALNTLLQSAGALIAKQATVIAYQDLCTNGYKWGKDFAMVAHVHDEMQFEVRHGLEEIVGSTVVNAMRKAGDHFKFRCPIDGEYKIGSNWKETH
jgi:DNA polymerase I